MEVTYLSLLAHVMLNLCMFASWHAAAHPCTLGVGPIGREEQVVSHINNNIVIDASRAFIQSVTTDLDNGTYGIGTVIPIAVNFSKIVKF